MLSEEEKKIRRRESQRKYHQSEKGKLTNRRYRTSEKGKLAESMYLKGEKGILTRERFLKTEKGAEYTKQINSSPTAKYKNHKVRAARRGIEWLFTFESWWEIWEPYWSRRGQASNDLQMCRHGDSGPYSPENVRLDTCANNVKEAWEIRRKENG